MKASWVVRFYQVVAFGMIGLFALASLRGWELRPTDRKVLPATVRNDPNGLRGFHFWPIVLTQRRRSYGSYGGYSGGK